MKKRRDFRAVDKHLRMLFAGGFWFKYCQSLHLIVPDDEALLLNYLINAWAMLKNGNKAREDGFFWRLQSQIYRDLLISATKQKVLFASLVKKNLIKTVKRKYKKTSRRYIKINKALILSKVLAATSALSDTEMGEWFRLPDNKKPEAVQQLLAAKKREYRLTKKPMTTAQKAALDKKFGRTKTRKEGTIPFRKNG